MKFPQLSSLLSLRINSENLGFEVYLLHNSESLLFPFRCHHVHVNHMCLRTWPPPSPPHPTPTPDVDISSIINMRLLDLIIFNELVLLYYGPPELLVIPEHLGLEFSLMQYLVCIWNSKSKKYKSSVHRRL